jgi:hypothetical protein
MLTRQFRWLLIRNGLSEDEADRTIQRIHDEFASATISDADQFHRLCETITRKLVQEFLSNKKPGKVRAVVSSIVTFVAGIGAEIIANKLTPFVPDFDSKTPVATRANLSTT